MTVTSAHNQRTKKGALKSTVYPFGRLILGVVGLVLVFSMIA